MELHLGAHLLHVALSGVDQQCGIGEFEAVPELLQLLLQDSHMLITVFQLGMANFLQNLFIRAQCYKFF